MANLTFPTDYAQRVYAGVLGKMIGVYVGRPVENWTYERLTAELGEVSYYVNHILKQPIIVADDDISGTFTFLRALEDHGFPSNLSAEQIGQSWMNYLIEDRTVLWWGGMGNSTEHTAYLRLKNGIPAPRSGSMELNGQVVAEQIGSQIFIDGWGLISPGNPQQAARFAKEASLVSHDGEAVYGAQVIAALVAAAFVEPDINKMIDLALAQIPATCLIAKLIADIRSWVAQDHDWRKTRQRLQDHYGYDKYGGNCHMIPNHGLIIMSLLYAPDDFSQAMLIVNTSGWDTDCNAANVGSIMGVRLGLAGINRDHDWRGPVADRALIPTADGGGCVTDAVQQTIRILSYAYKLAGQPYEAPKGGARFSFAFPGSVQGFLPIPTEHQTPTACVENIACSKDPQHRLLAIHTCTLGAKQIAGAFVATYFQPDELKAGGYGLYGSPILYTGQSVGAQLILDPQSPPVAARLAVVYYGEEDKPKTLTSDWLPLTPSQLATLTWTIPDTQGCPIFQLRLEFQGPAASVYVDHVCITGTPHTSLFATHTKNGEQWRKAWVDAVSTIWIWNTVELSSPGLRVIQNRDTGTVSIGTADWHNYRFQAVAIPHLAEAFGLAIAYRGLTRHLRFMIHHDGTARLTQVDHNTTRELARAKVPFELYKKYVLAVEWTGTTLRCVIDGKEPFPAVTLSTAPAPGGGVALVVTEGRVAFTEAQIQPA